MNNDNNLFNENEGIKPINLNNEKNEGHWLQIATVCAIKLILSVIAVYLVLDCSPKSNIIIKFISSVIAFVFSELYIIYYAIYRIFMGNKCPS